MDYIACKSSRSQVYVPHTAGRYQVKKFRKALCPIVERLVGSMQFAGRNTGKKVKAIRIVRHAFEIVHLFMHEFIFTSIQLLNTFNYNFIIVVS